MHLRTLALSTLAAAAGTFLCSARGAHASDVDNPFCLTSNPINYALNALVPLGDNPTGVAPMKRKSVFVPPDQRQGLTVKRLVVFGDHFGKDGDLPPRASVELQSLMESADLVLGNVEAPITYNGNALEPSAKQAFNFHQNVAYLRSAMAQACMDPARTVFTVANNHAGDGDRWYPTTDASGAVVEPGTPTTASMLGLRGVVGVDRSVAVDPAIQLHDLGDLRVGVVAWTHLQNTAPRTVNNQIVYPTWEASKRVLASNFKARKAALGIDLLIGMPHWDCQWFLFPRTQTVQTADTLHDIGFNLVLGSHPGIWQPAKRLGEANGAVNPHNDLVFFSMGNFNEVGILNNYPAPVLELLVDQNGRTLEFTMHAFVVHKEAGDLAKVVTCPSGRKYADNQPGAPVTRTSQLIIKPLDALQSSPSDRDAWDNFTKQFERVFPSN
jgi:hypothetical protein